MTTSEHFTHWDIMNSFCRCHGNLQQRYFWNCRHWSGRIWAKILVHKESYVWKTRWSFMKIEDIFSFCDFQKKHVTMDMSIVELHGAQISPMFRIPKIERVIPSYHTSLKSVGQYLEKGQCYSWCLQQTPDGMAPRCLSREGDFYIRMRRVLKAFFSISWTASFRNSCRWGVAEMDCSRASLDRGAISDLWLHDVHVIVLDNHNKIVKGTYRLYRQ